MRIFWIAAFVVLMLGGSAIAQVAPQRAIDMTAELHDEFGRAIKDPRDRAADDAKCDKCPPMTLGHFVSNILFNVPDSDDPHAKPNAEKMWARGILAMKIRDDKAAVLTADQITDIKALVARGAPTPLFIMQVFPLLDPNAKPG